MWKLLVLSANTVRISELENKNKYRRSWEKKITFSVFYAKRRRPRTFYVPYIPIPELISRTALIMSNIFLKALKNSTARLYLKFTQNPLRRHFVPYKTPLRELYLGILIYIKYFNCSVTINVLKSD